MQYLGCSLDRFSLPPVVAARKLYADTVAQLPLVAIRDRSPRDDQPALLKRPDPAEPRWLTMHRAVNGLTRDGIVYLIVTARDAAGYAVAVRVADAGTVTPTLDPFGQLAAVSVQGRPIDLSEVVAIPYNVDGQGRPSSPVDDAADVLDAFAALYCMAGSFWRAGYPSLAVTTSQRLTAAQASELKASLLAAWSESHVPAVLDNDAKIAPLGASAQESQLVDSFSVVVAEVARVFQIPPSLLNAPVAASLTYATTETEFRRWLATGLQPMLMRLEAAFSDLLPYGTTARFDTSELARADLAARANAYSTILAGQPWMTSEEVRSLEGLAPLEGAPVAPSPSSLPAPEAVAHG